MPHFWAECPTFLVVGFLIYIYIYNIILKIIVRLLNAFHLHLFSQKLIKKSQLLFVVTDINFHDRFDISHKDEKNIYGEIYGDKT